MRMIWMFKENMNIISNMQNSKSFWIFLKSSGDPTSNASVMGDQTWPFRLADFRGSYAKSLEKNIPLGETMCFLTDVVDVL